MKAKKKNYRPLPTKGVLYVRSLPPRLRQIFRAVCYRRGYSMTRVVAALMRFYVDHPEMIQVRRWANDVPPGTTADDFLDEPERGED